jgi:hypothetical protein
MKESYEVGPSQSPWPRGPTQGLVQSAAGVSDWAVRRILCGRFGACGPIAFVFRGFAPTANRCRRYAATEPGPQGSSWNSQPVG